MRKPHSYETLKAAVKGLKTNIGNTHDFRMKVDITEALGMIRDGLNAPKFVYDDGPECHVDFDVAILMMQQDVMRMPFDLFVIESTYTKPGYRNIDQTLVVKKTGDNKIRIMALTGLLHKQSNDVSSLTLEFNNKLEYGFGAIMDGKIMEVKSTKENGSSFEDNFAFSIAQSVFGMVAALVQCQARTTRFGFKHRTSRHPVPQEWDGQPFYTYTVVHKERNPLPVVRREARPTGIHQRRHLRMGHWRFKNDPDKRRWIEPYYAGDAKLGFVFKDYEIAKPT